MELNTLRPGASAWFGLVRTTHIVTSDNPVPARQLNTQIEIVSWTDPPGQMASRSTGRPTLAAKRPHLHCLHTFNYSDVAFHAATGANIILPHFIFARQHRDTPPARVRGNNPSKRGMRGI